MVAQYASAKDQLSGLSCCHLEVLQKFGSKFILIELRSSSAVIFFKAVTPYAPPAE
jgi:hypothetical protein